MNEIAIEPPVMRWAGLDHGFQAAAMAAAQTDEGRAVRSELEARFMYGPGKPFLLGPPLAIKAEYAAPFRRLTRAYHAAIEAVVHAYGRDEEVRRVIPTATKLAAVVRADVDPANCCLHICRLDLLLGSEGRFWVLETNGNCPGGFVFSGPVNRAWRELLSGQGISVPPPLRHEEENFMARWFLEVAEEATGRKPEFVVLLREEGGNRLELDFFLDELHAEGIDAAEADPRDLVENGSGGLELDGRPVKHAYLKLGMQPFLRMRPELDTFVRAVRERRLWVQNGQRGRWVGDNKLCLAVISDPRFRSLFDPADWAFLQEHLPWSRNMALLDGDQAESVRSNSGDYVLKRPLDTRGAGVVVGQGTSQDEWGQSVDVAEAEGWLIQRFHETARVERNFDGTGFNRHDIALGAIKGELTTTFARSSEELRVNMARTGRMHPVFLGA